MYKSFTLCTSRILTRRLFTTAKGSQANSGSTGTWDCESTNQKKSNNANSDEQMRESDPTAKSSIKEKINNAVFVAEEKAQDTFFAAKEKVVNTMVNLLAKSRETK